MNRSATISPCGRYRYTLERSWNPGTRATFIMLNPSTADASVDDATIRKCIGFATRWGFNGINVVNLFAHRSRSPKELWSDPDSCIGPDNDENIQRTVRESTCVVVAFGCFPKAMKRALEVRKLIDSCGVSALSLGTSRCGRFPRHPLMLAYATPLQPYQLNAD